LCVSAALVNEYLAVIGRPKFAQYPDFADSAKAVVDHIISKATIFHPTKRLNIQKDKNDNFLLELADDSNAD
jgi:putative PIN family toxin of toxin-antitoxin system